MNPRVTIAATGAITAALAGFVAHWEGEKFVPYRDIGGVWTVCNGITGPAVIPGKVYSRQECRDLLNGELLRHAAGLAKCLEHAPPQKTLSALISWAYNVGVGAACKSTLVRLVNARQFYDACLQLPRWNRVGGKPVRGLTNRRNAELAWCLEGLGIEPPLPVPPNLGAIG